MMGGHGAKVLGEMLFGKNKPPDECVFKNDTQYNVRVLADPTRDLPPGHSETVSVSHDSSVKLVLQVSETDVRYKFFGNNKDDAYMNFDGETKMISVIFKDALKAIQDENKIVIHSIDFKHIGDLPANVKVSTHESYSVTDMHTTKDTDTNSFTATFEASAGLTLPSGPTASAKTTAAATLSRIVEKMSSSTFEYKMEQTVDWEPANEHRKIWALTIMGSNNFIYINKKFTFAQEKKPEDPNWEETVF